MSGLRGSATVPGAAELLCHLVEDLGDDDLVATVGFRPVSLLSHQVLDTHGIRITAFDRDTLRSLAGRLGEKLQRVPGGFDRDGAEHIVLQAERYVDAYAVYVRVLATVPAETGDPVRDGEFLP